MDDQTQRILDRESLKKKSYEERVKLLRNIGSTYNVKIYPAKDGKNGKDIMKSVMIRECPTHGKIEVGLAAFVVRGNFACHLCVRELHAELSRKPEQLKSGVTKYDERNVYLAVSECGNYLKVGVTAGEPERRIKQVTGAAPIKFTQHTYVHTSGHKSSILEKCLKRTFSKHIQSDLGKFPGSTEIVDLRSLGMNAEQLRLRIRRLEGKGREVKLTKEVVTFPPFIEIRYKSDEVAERAAKETEQLKASLCKDITFFLLSRINAANEYYAEEFVGVEYEGFNYLSVYAGRSVEFDLGSIITLTRPDLFKTKHIAKVGEEEFEVSPQILRFGGLSDIVLAVAKQLPKS